VLAILVIGLLRYGLGLINVQSQIIMIIVGALLIIAVAIPNLKSSVGGIKSVRNLFGGSKNVNS
jgi:rhamnose transport system permease protein